MKRLACLAAAIALQPLPAFAQTGIPAPSSAAERRLSPEQIEAVLAEAARKREAGETRGLPGSDELPVARRPEGEVGVSIGTGGYREVVGTAIYPLGDDGTAAISLDLLDHGKRRTKR